jgi:hypothetical protein
MYGQVSLEWQISLAAAAAAPSLFTIYLARWHLPFS